MGIGDSAYNFDGGGDIPLHPNGFVDWKIEGDGFDNLNLPEDCLDFFPGDDDDIRALLDMPYEVDNFLQPMPEINEVPELKQLSYYVEDSVSDLHKFANHQEMSCVLQPTWSQINEVPEIKQSSISVCRDSGLDTHKFVKLREMSSVFQPTSPVSELESSGSCSGAKSLPSKITRSRSKLAKRSGVNLWRAAAPDFAAVTAARRAPYSRQYKKRTKKRPQLSVVKESVKDSFDYPENPATMKRCTHCQISKTPQWREGPAGPKTLCNACGVRFRSGRLCPEYRPAASPTFVPSLHSNSHKKVIEMRNKAKQHMTVLKEPPITPQPEFIPGSSCLDFELKFPLETTPF